MGSFTKGDIVLFPFPYTDLKGSKIRPCLILSDEMREDIVLCQITSQRIVSDAFSIELKEHETEGGSLKIDSFIRCNMLFTANKSQIVKVLCKVNAKKYKQVVKKVNELISK